MVAATGAQTGFGGSKLFGATTQAAPVTTSLFGQTTQPPQVQSSFFGSAATQPAVATTTGFGGFGGFGGGGATTSSVFGGQQQAKPSIFGGLGQTTQPQASSLFGSTVPATAWYVLNNFFV